MPFYRIIIYTKDKQSISGIQQYEQGNIETEHQICYRKAAAFYGRSFLDIEVQMLSKISKAAKKHLGINQTSQMH